MIEKQYAAVLAFKRMFEPDLLWFLLMALAAASSEDTNAADHQES